MPSARAMVNLALRDETSKNYLIELWSECFPSGINKKILSAGVGKDKGKATDIKNNFIHNARHIFYAVSYYHKINEKVSIFKGFDISHFLTIGLPQNESDSSLILSSFTELCAVPGFRDTISRILEKELKNIKKSLLVENSLRDLLKSIIDSTDDKYNSLADKIITYLLDTKFLEEQNYSQIDLLMSWVKTVKFLSVYKNNYREYTETIPDVLKELYSIAIKDYNERNERKEILHKLVLKLSEILNEDIWQTNEIRENSINVVTVLLLSQMSEISDVAIQNVLGLTKHTYENYKFNGPVKIHIYSFVLLLLTKRRITSRIFFLEKEYDEEIIIYLSSIDNDYVAIQLAVQIEILLRIRKNSLEQVRFLWSLLLADPNSKVFLELYKLLKGDSTPLHDVVMSIYDLDNLRDNKIDSIEDFVASYNKLTIAVKKLLNTDSGNIEFQEIEILRKESEKLIDLLNEIANLNLTKYDSFIENSQKLNYKIIRLKELLGSGDKSLLIKWFKYLNVDLSKLEVKWERFLAAYNDVNNSLPIINDNQISELLITLKELENELQRITWPELRILIHLSDYIKKWINELSLLLIKTNNKNLEIIDLVKNRKDLNSVTKIVRSLLNDEEELKMLFPETIKAIHHYLQINLEIQLSELFRKNEIISKKVTLNSFFKFISPSLIGVIAGPFIVLDIGSVWSELVLQGKEFYYYLTVILSLSVALFLFYIKFSQKGSKSLSRYNLLKKSILVFLSSYIIAFFTSFLVIFTLSETSLTSEIVSIVDYIKVIIIWSSLSVLLGWFIGTILQGKDLIDN